MINELSALESKITQVATLCHDLRAENAQLRQQIAGRDGEMKNLSERMQSARSRLEQLAEQLPAASA